MMGDSLSEYALSPTGDSPEQVRATSSVPWKKGTVRAWMVLNTAGQAEVVEAGKYAIMRRTGLPGRDLRILDPLLSYPSTILGRERAIVINLENIKAIITCHEVLLLNSRNPSVTPFIVELQKRLHCHYHATRAQVRLKQMLYFSYFIIQLSYNRDSNLGYIIQLNYKIML
jgi:hypothetical protein